MQRLPSLTWWHGSARWAMLAPDEQGQASRHHAVRRDSHGRDRALSGRRGSEIPDVTQLGANDLVVLVKSAAVGWVDLLMTSGQYQHMPSPPYTPGLEYSGEVFWSGAEAKLPPGRAVLGFVYGKDVAARGDTLRVLALGQASFAMFALATTRRARIAAQSSSCSTRRPPSPNDGERRGARVNRSPMCLSRRRQNLSRSKGPTSPRGEHGMVRKHPKRLPRASRPR